MPSRDVRKSKVALVAEARNVIGFAMARPPHAQVITARPFTKLSRLLSSFLGVPCVKAFAFGLGKPLTRGL